MQLKKGKQKKEGEEEEEIKYRVLNNFTNFGSVANQNYYEF